MQMENIIFFRCFLFLLYCLLCQIGQSTITVNLNDRNRNFEFGMLKQ